MPSFPVHFFLRLCYLPRVLQSPLLSLFSLVELTPPPQGQPSLYLLPKPSFDFLTLVHSASDPLKDLKGNDFCLFWGVCGKTEFWHQSVLVAVVLFLLSFFVYLARFQIFINAASNHLDHFYSYIVLLTSIRNWVSQLVINTLLVG